MSIFDKYLEKAKSKSNAGSRGKAVKNSGYSAIESFTDATEDENIHEGHRRRMRERYEKDPDMETFAPHEVLELYLFNAVPRKDTNEIAHMLINTFGSLSAVFEASVDDLMSVKDMTENAAMMIRQTLTVADIYHRMKFADRAALGNAMSVSQYYRSFFMNKNRELAYAALLDINDCIISTENVGKGAAATVDIDSVKLMRNVREKYASKVIFMHNHPSGNVYPSDIDLVTTSSMMVSLHMMGVRLVDHVIFSPDGYYFSFFQNGLIAILGRRCNTFFDIDVMSRPVAGGDGIVYGRGGVGLSFENYEACENELLGDGEEMESYRDLAERFKNGIVHHVDDTVDD